MLQYIVATAPQASALTKRMLGSLPLAPLPGNAALPAYLDSASVLFASQMRTEAVEGVTEAREKRPASWNHLPT